MNNVKTTITLHLNIFEGMERLLMFDSTPNHPKCFTYESNGIFHKRMRNFFLQLGDIYDDIQQVLF